MSAKQRKSRAVRPLLFLAPRFKRTRRNTQGFYTNEKGEGEKMRGHSRTRGGGRGEGTAVPRPSSATTTHAQGTYVCLLSLLPLRFAEHAQKAVHTHTPVQDAAMIRKLSLPYYFVVDYVCGQTRLRRSKVRGAPYAGLGWQRGWQDRIVIFFRVGEHGLLKRHE